MSEYQTDIDLLELASLNRASSLSNHSEDTSTSSRSTLIKELVTSEKSKKIIDDIDLKITQLVEIIKAKKCKDKRNKYYAKKIVSRIIDKKCSDTTINTVNFGKSTLPSSTPFDSGREKSVSISKSKSPNNSNGSTHSKNGSPKETEKLISPTSKSPNNINSSKNGSPKETECHMSNKIEENNNKIKPVESFPTSYESTPLTTNRNNDLRERLKKLSDEIALYIQTPSTESPNNLRRTSEATNNIMNKVSTKYFVIMSGTSKF